MNDLLAIYKKNSEKWHQFSTITTGNLQEVDNWIQEAENKRKALENTIEHIKELSKHAQAKTYVKICPRTYVGAVIKHTGEYNVNINSEYQCTYTKDQTVEYLEEQIAEQNGIIENYKIQKGQLLRRLGLNFEETLDIPDTADMPDKIITDKGMAFKQGHFYEIMEIETNSVCEESTKRMI